jgi:hypothetical protein
MDLILIVLGLLGLAAILVASYVFVVAARAYVSDDPRDRDGTAWIERNKGDRRSGNPVQFPMTVNGLLIEADRRMGPRCRREVMP